MSLLPIHLVQPSSAVASAIRRRTKLQQHLGRNGNENQDHGLTVFREQGNQGVCLPVSSEEMVANTANVDRAGSTARDSTCRDCDQRIERDEMSQTVNAGF